jgi:hypothetical protein
MVPGVGGNEDRSTELGVFKVVPEECMEDILMYNKELDVDSSIKSIKEWPKS